MGRAGQVRQAGSHERGPSGPRLVRRTPRAGIGRRAWLAGQRLERPQCTAQAGDRGLDRGVGDTSGDVDAVLEPLRGHRRYNAIMALRSLFRFAKRRGLTFADPTRHLRGGRGAGRTLLPMTAEQIRAVEQAAANRHVLVSRIGALGTGPVSADYLDKHQLHGISLEQIRRDRILAEALATGADPLHLALVFNIDHTNAMAYANAARNLLTSPAEKPLSRRPK